MEKHSVPVTFAGMMAAFLIWAAHFGAIYGINGLICARKLDAMELFGLPLASALVLAVTAAALLLVAFVLLAALWGGRPAAWASEEPRRFIRWFTAFAAGRRCLPSCGRGCPPFRCRPVRRRRVERR